MKVVTREAPRRSGGLGRALKTSSGRQRRKAATAVGGNGWNRLRGTCKEEAGPERCSMTQAGGFTFTPNEAENREAGKGYTSQKWLPEDVGGDRENTCSMEPLAGRKPYTGRWGNSSGHSS